MSASLAILAAEAPYRPPAQLDLERIESLLAAKVSAAEDHIWAMREDPGYFAEMLQEAREDRWELVRDADGNIHPEAEGNGTEEFWASVIGNCLLYSIIDLEVFAELRRQVAELQSLKTKYDPVISTSKKLPKEYLGALLKFHYFLELAVNPWQRRLGERMGSSPPVRRLCVRTTVRAPSLRGNLCYVNFRDDVKHTEVERQLMFLLGEILNETQILSIITLTIIMDELERLLEAESEARELIAPYIAGTISYLSILAECTK